MNAAVIRKEEAVNKSTILSRIIITFSPLVLVDKGEVVKEDFFGSGNSIIETPDGWYVAAEHYSGVYLYE